MNIKNKLIIALISSCMMIICIAVIIHAKTNNSVVGLNNIANLQIRNVKTDNELNDMVLARNNAFNDYWPYWLETTKEMGWTNGKSDDELYQEQWDLVKPDFDFGFLINCLKTDKYLLQYAQAERLGYLFSNTQYWSVESSNFTLEGNYITDINEYFSDVVYKVAIDNEEKEFITDINKIEDILLDANISSVTEVKLFSLLDLMSFMYIKGDAEEYIIKVSDHIGQNGYIPDIERFKLYPAKTVINEIVKLAEDDQFSYNKHLPQNSALQKSTYEAEAESLQQEGLLQGNENGLDLLKPLTRAEAVTLLIRAMGLEDQIANYTVSQFADIASDNWTSPYAALAKEKGITNGISDTEFAPDDPVTADQFATFTLRAAGESNFDYTQGIQILIDRGIITEEESETMDLFTRGDMAKIIYEAREEGLL